jgi:hypothetical protein
MTLPTKPGLRVATYGQGNHAMNTLCNIEASFKLASRRKTIAAQPREDVSCEFAFPRLISVCSFGLIILGAHRRFDRILDAVAIVADVHDLASLD